jgi:hypothetical protein
MAENNHLKHNYAQKILTTESTEEHRKKKTTDHTDNTDSMNL